LICAIISLFVASGAETPSLSVMSFNSDFRFAVRDPDHGAVGL
jgi:hypothetical protein